MTEPTQPCSTCTLDLPLSCFGVCRAKKSGRNIYCKKCARDRVYLFREQGRANAAARKQMMIAKTPAYRVKAAIESGARSYFEIVRKAKLGTDTVGDALVELMLEQGVVRTEVVNGTRQYFLRTA